MRQRMGLIGLLFSPLTHHVIQETINDRDVQSVEQTILHDGDQIVIIYSEHT